MKIHQLKNQENKINVSLGYQIKSIKRRKRK